MRKGHIAAGFPRSVRAVRRACATPRCAAPPGCAQATAAPRDGKPLGTPAKPISDHSATRSFLSFRVAGLFVVHCSAPARRPVCHCSPPIRYHTKYQQGSASHVAAPQIAVSPVADAVNPGAFLFANTCGTPCRLLS